MKPPKRRVKYGMGSADPQTEEFSAFCKRRRSVYVVNDRTFVLYSPLHAPPEQLENFGRLRNLRA